MALSSCKWLCRDPIQEQGGINLTAYCANDPINQHDPTGLETAIMSFDADVINGVPMVRRRMIEWTFLNGRAGAKEILGSRTGWEKAGADDWYWFYKVSDGSWGSVDYGMASARKFGADAPEQAKGFALFMGAQYVVGVGLVAAPTAIPSILRVTPSLLKGETARRIYNGAGGTLIYRVGTEATGQDTTWGGYIGSFSSGAIGGYWGAFSYASLSQGIDVYISGEQNKWRLDEYGYDLIFGFGLTGLSSGLNWIPKNIRKFYEPGIKVSKTLKHGRGAAGRAVRASLRETEEYVKWNRIDSTTRGLCDIFFPYLGEVIDSKTGMEVEE